MNKQPLRASGKSDLLAHQFSQLIFKYYYLNVDCIKMCVFKHIIVSSLLTSSPCIPTTSSYDVIPY